MSDHPKRLKDLKLPLSLKDGVGADLIDVQVDGRRSWSAFFWFSDDTPEPVRKAFERIEDRTPAFDSKRRAKRWLWDLLYGSGRA